MSLFHRKEDPNVRLIKRYANRKLYDTTERHYVTLADVANSIRKGDEVKVTDYITAADLTNQTLAQIIFEESKKAPRVETELLSQLIRSSRPIQHEAPVHQEAPAS